MKTPGLIIPQAHAGGAAWCGEPRTGAGARGGSLNWGRGGSADLELAGRRDLSLHGVCSCNEWLVTARAAVSSCARPAAPRLPSPPARGAPAAHAAARALQATLFTEPSGMLNSTTGWLGPAATSTMK